MPGFWTRRRRYMTGLWLGAAVLTAVLLVLSHRTNNSWLLLLWLALLLIPLVVVSITWDWFTRTPRKRWKRHDVEDALAAEARAARAAGRDRPRPDPPAP